jgi:hypothetical protein
MTHNIRWDRAFKQDSGCNASCGLMILRDFGTDSLRSETTA